MALEPDAIDLEGLPRTIGGGLKREPVEELLKRVQWEYSQLYYEHKVLKDGLERSGGADLEPPAAPVEAPGSSTTTAAPERDDGPVARIERALRGPVEIAPTAPEPPTPAEPAPAQPIAHAPHREVDDLARLVLASAHRASIELRESARRDCELMLKKTRERVVELERSFERTEAKRTADLAELDREFERVKAERTAELAELEELMSEIREQMKATLEVLIPEPSRPDADPEVTEAADPDGSGAVTLLRPAEAPASEGAASTALGRSDLEATP